MTKLALTITAVFVILGNVVVYAQERAVTVPAGSFSRGSAAGKADEAPVRTVSISSFGMMPKEVTEAQYRKCVDAGACSPAHYDDGKCFLWDGRRFQRVVVPNERRGDGFPVVCVTWQQARAYCASVGMRLPTEAQWEYAALGGLSSRYSWGNDQPSSSRCALGALRPAGSFPANRYGLHDMTGNAWEWTADFYAADHYETSEETDPRGPSAGYYRVIRGGGWYSGSAELRIQNRHWFTATSAEVSLGFRCAR